ANQGKRSPLKVAIWTGVGILVGTTVLAVVFGSDSKKADTGLKPTSIVDRSDTISAAEKDAAPTEAVRPEAARQMTTVVTTDVVQSEPVTKEEAEQAAIRYTKTAVNLREGPGTKFPVISVIP